MNRPCLLTIACLSIASQVFAMQGTKPPAEPASKGAPALRVPDALLAPPASKDVPDEAPAPMSDGVTTPAPFDPAAYRRTVNAANAAMRAQDWKAASDNLQQALAMRPDSKEVAYNLGVAKFQQGDFAAARKLFQESGQNTSADLAARSMYNQGNAIYADAMKNLPKAADNGKPPAGAAQAPQIPPEELQKALQQVEQAFTHFKDASAANPSDEDSAANAETSLKLMKELKKLQEQQQQQQQQNKDQQQKQDQKKDQQQKQDQQQSQDQQQKQQDKQQDQQKQDQQQQKDQQQQQQQSQGQDQQSASKQDSKQQDQKDSQQKDQQDQSGKDQQKKDQPKPNQADQPKQDSKQQQQQQPNKDQQKPDQAQQNKPEPKQAKPEDQNKDQSPQQAQPQQAEPGQAQGAEMKQGKMDRTQADQLLQMVRDKEKERNAEKKAQQARIRPTPVDRDW
jgi:Ca-activated chloride channel family protein